MYQIIDVPANAPEDPEPLGSKDKFWYADQEYLFKEARDDSGEDWAERVCAELAGRLGLPHADYELATWQRAGLPVRGVISRNFCRNGAALILGNELLPEADPAYAPGISKFRVSAHTLDRVLMTLHNFDPRLPPGWTCSPQISQASELFLGYLLLDALVGNTDRHHENWGVLRMPHGTIHLAPTFDHASSLGCHERDEKKHRRLITRDKNFRVEAFAAKARSALYLNEEDAQPLLTRDAFLQCARYLPAAGRLWLARLHGLGKAEIAILVDNVPRERISEISAEFAKRLLLANQRELLKVEEILP